MEKGANSSKFITYSKPEGVSTYLVTTAVKGNNIVFSKTIKGFKEGLLVTICRRSEENIRVKE